MSEVAVVAAPPAAPVAPVVPVAPAAVEAPKAPVVAPIAEKPESVKDARQRLREAARGVKIAEVVNQRSEQAQTQPRDESGKFVDPNGAAAPAPASVTPPAVDGPPEGFVRLPVPENHPLRARGVQFMDFPKAQEEYGRYAINQGVRASQLEEATRTTRTLESQVAEKAAEAAFWREHGQSLFGPDFQQTYNDLKATYGEAQAEVFKKGRMAEAAEKIAAVTNEARQKTAQGVVVREAERFRDLAIQDARKTFPHWSDQEARAVLARYGAYMASRGEANLTAVGWRTFAAPLYAQHPTVKVELTTRFAAEKASERERLRAEVVSDMKAQEAERLKDAGARRAANPMGSLPPVPATVPPDAPPAGTVQQRRDALRRKARGLT